MRFPKVSSCFNTPTGTESEDWPVVSDYATVYDAVLPDYYK